MFTIDLKRNITEFITLIKSEEFQSNSSTDQKKIINHFEKDILQELKRIQQLEVEKNTLGNDLVRSRNILRSLFDNLPDLIYVINRDYEITAVNIALSRKIKQSPKAIVGQICYEKLYMREDPCPDCKILETIESRIVTTRNKKEKTSETEFSDWEINTYPIFDDKCGVTHIILVERDVTEKQRMELLVAQSEKMAAVGQLAAGFAHEINNPLSVIMANAQILMREIPHKNDWLELLQRINSAGARSLDIVKNLLDFARWECMDPEPIDVNTTITKALCLIHHVSQELEAEIIFQSASNLPVIPASAGNLQSVWVNLILNGLDAVEPGKGRIVIKSCLDENEIVVTISDNGKGIPAERINQIFDPFFTTKDPGKGTGLGLSICHTIVKQHGGLIEVDSIVGEGTIFKIRLPINLSK